MRSLVALAVFVAAAALLGIGAPEALARGGGGGGYGGGGDGGGGGGDGGDWSWLIWLLFRYPQVGIPVLLIVIVAGIVGGKKGQRARTASVIVRGDAAAEAVRHAEVSAALKAADPGFDEAAFLARVRVAFRKVQQGWCEHRPEDFRPFVSDGIHERFALQIAEQETLGYRDRMDRVEVRGAAFAQRVVDGAFDTVTVRIEAAAADYRVLLEDGRFVSGSKDVEAFVEYWSFLRRAGATTKPGAAGLIEGTCPNCGAAVEPGGWAICTHCKAHLRSGERDWVLAEITQAVEWREETPESALGTEALRARDPAFSVQHLEDRASVLFWRKATADRLGDARLLRRVASPAFLAGYEATLAAEAKEERGFRRWFGECAVGSVETQAIVAEEGTDRAILDVRWQGTAFTREPGKMAVAAERGGVTWTRFVLSRRSGVLTRAQDVVSSAHCPGCGAPDLGGETGSCEYCGAALNDGGRDWVLEEVVAWSDPRWLTRIADLRRMEEAARAAIAPPPALGADAGPADAKDALLAWMAKAAAADGAVDAAEREVLAGVARKAGMREARIEELLVDTARPGYAAPEPRGVSGTRTWIAAMADVALADGRIAPAEAALLEGLGARHGLAAYDVRQILAQVRAHRFAQAKASLARRKALESN